MQLVCVSAVAKCFTASSVMLLCLRYKLFSLQLVCVSAVAKYLTPSSVMLLSQRSNLSPLDCLALVHALKSVEGILDFHLAVNNLQSLGCIEIVKLLPGNQNNQGFCELKRLNLAFN